MNMGTAGTNKSMNIKPIFEVGLAKSVKINKSRISIGNPINKEVSLCRFIKANTII